MIDYQIVDFMAGQLADQYATQKASGFSYPNEEELPRFFRAQAAKLAANGVTNIYDVGTQERETEKIIAYNDDGSPVYGPSTEQFLINKQTGQDIRDVVLKPTWEEDPEAYRFRKPAILETTPAGFTRWGKDLSVEGQGDYGLNFVDGVPVYTPFWKDTATDPGAIIMAGALLGAGLYQLAGAGAAAGAAEVGTAGATAGTGAGISGAGLTSAEMAALKGAEAYGAGVGTGMAISGAGLTSAEMAALKGSEAAYGAASPGMAISGAGLTSAEMQALKGAEAYGPGATSSLVPALKTAGDVARVANLANSLLNPPTIQQQMGVPQQGLLGGGQARGVDFSPLYQNTLVGLLPTAELYRRSLL